jgi:hypothetical protein
MVPNKALNCMDYFILLTSIIWHDVGMVSKRTGHAKEALVFIDKVRELCLYDQTIHRVITEIIQAHSGTNGFDTPGLNQECSPCSKHTCTIYPKAIASVLRFADEVSENRTRISIPLLKSVPADKRIYWEYANAITAAKVEPTRNRILIIVEMQREDALQEHKCPDEFSKYAHADGKISLIEFFICRLEKMNNERIYCFPYLTRYALITQIEVQLKVCEGVKCEKYDGIILGEGGLGEAQYPELTFFQDFFKSYPKLNPENLRRLC